MSTYLDQLKALRRESELLTEEMASPYHDQPDAKYARALRKQKIEREIATLKSENITLVWEKSNA